MNLDFMAFLAGSSFIFGSWICEADCDGKLQSRLLKELEPREVANNSPDMVTQLAEDFARLSTSDPTRMTEQGVYDYNTIINYDLVFNLDSKLKAPSPFLLELGNTAPIV